MNNKGIAIILVIGLLSLLMVIGISFLVLMRFQEKQSFNYLSLVRAKNIAKLGMEKAIVQLKKDKNGYDVETETWRSNFIGDEVDLDEDGKEDSRWFNLFRKGKLIGRYTVLVKDEEGKLNINEAGNLSKGFYAKEQGISEGWKPDEIKLTALPGIDDGLSKAIIEYKYGKDKAPGRAGDDDDKDNDELIDDGIDSDGDGDYDEGNEGIDEPDEFCARGPSGDDQPFVTIEDLKRVKGIAEKKFAGVKNLITAYSYDKNINSKGELRVNLNSASIAEIKSALSKSGINEPDIYNQIAVNIIDYRDRDDIPTIYLDPDAGKEGKTYYGIEETPYINEVEASPIVKKSPIKIGIISFMIDSGEYIELFNPYSHDIPIGGWTITGSGKGIYFGITQPVFVPITPGAVIQAKGYYTVGDGVATIVAIIRKPPYILLIPWLITPSPSGCDQYFPLELPDFGANLKLTDNLGHTIEIANYGVDIWTPLSKERNDPRVRNFYPGLKSPGKQNTIFSASLVFGKEVNLLNWQSSFMVKNYPLATVGEMGYLHKGKQWQTINFWKGSNDDIAVCDQFSTAEPVKKPMRGRININTASCGVLMGLPGVEKELAEKIIAARSFKTIGEVCGDYFADNEEPEKILNRAMIAQGNNFSDSDDDGFIDEDDEKEETFRKISNLITVRSNLFSIVSLAQSLRDKNGDGKVDDGEILAEKKIKVIYNRGSFPRKICFYKEVE